jgi:hypothetical protein
MTDQAQDIIDLLARAAEQLGKPADEARIMAASLFWEAERSYTANGFPYGTSVDGFLRWIEENGKTLRR